MLDGTVGNHRMGQARLPGAVSSRGRERPVPAAVRIRDDLRDAIASLRLRPGVAILEKDLAQTYGVSRTPVREAVAKLVQEGLVSVFPQAGTFVSRIPFRELPETLVIRGSLEATSARLAAASASEVGVAQIGAALTKARRAASARDEDAFHRADEAFHAAIAEAAGYPKLWQIVQQVKVQLDRFRRLTLPQAGRFTRVLDEHEAVFRAIAQGDAGGASAAMEAHVGGLLADLDAIARAHPDCFDLVPPLERDASPTPRAGTDR
jgi:GntR family transcriptional regulator, rspAB operon transcriptional repressor